MNQIFEDIITEITYKIHSYVIIIKANKERLTYFGLRNYWKTDYLFSIDLKKTNRNIGYVIKQLNELIETIEEAKKLLLENENTSDYEGNK